MRIWSYPMVFPFRTCNNKATNTLSSKYGQEASSASHLLYLLRLFVQRALLGWYCWHRWALQRRARCRLRGWWLTLFVYRELLRSRCLPTSASPDSVRSRGLTAVFIAFGQVLNFAKDGHAVCAEILLSDANESDNAPVHRHPNGIGHKGLDKRCVAFVRYRLDL